MELRGPQVERMDQIQQGVHADIAQRTHNQRVFREFEVSEAERSKRRGIQSRISPIDPKCTLPRVLDTIESDIFLQEGRDLISRNLGKGGRL